MLKSTFKNDMAGLSSLHGDSQMLKNNDFFKSKIGKSLSDSSKLLVDLELKGKCFYDIPVKPKQG